MSANSADRTWYLRDEPLESLDEEDRLRHKGYVHILLNTIRELLPPFTLGIFGSWGVGKTSIVKDLHNSIVTQKALPSMTSVYIDVWKYEGDSLRRQLLLDVEKQLKDIKALDSSHNIEAQLYRDVAVDIQNEQRFSWRRLREAAPQLIMVALVIVAVFLLLSMSTINQVWKAVISAVVLTFLFHLFKGIAGTVIVQQRVTATEHGLYSSEQFEKAFINLIDEATSNEKLDKVVIIIDNLDRCSSDRIVEVLGVVKTYLEPKSSNKCVFIVPCDDVAIKKHVKSAYGVSILNVEEKEAEGYADEYIRKFFNASLIITPFIKKEMETYIEIQLNKIRLTENMTEDDLKTLTQMMGLVFRKNPRQIIQFLNNLTGKYLLVKEREQGPNPMIQPTISDNILFLAKVSIIETKFPKWFQQFVADDNLYGEALKSMYTPGTNLIKDDDLWEFLDFTGHVIAKNYKAFFHLKQSPHEAKIPNYDQFLDAVHNGKREEVSELFDEGDEESNQARLEEIVNLIRENAIKKYGEIALNVMKVGCAIALKLSKEYQGQIARIIIGTLVAHSNLRERISFLFPTEVFALLPFVQRNESEKIIDRYIEVYSQEPEVIEAGVNLRLEIAKCAVDNLQQLTNSQLEKLRNTTAEFKAINPELLKLISSTKEAKISLVSPALINTVVQEINPEETAQFVQTSEFMKEHAPLIEFVVRCQDLGNGDIAISWGKKLVEMLQSAVNQNNAQLEEYIQRCIDDSVTLLTGADSDTLNQIVDLVVQRYPQGAEYRRTATAHTLSFLYPHCSEEQQSKIRNLIVNEFVWSESPSNVAGFMATQADNEFERLPYHSDVFNRLAERILAKQDDEERQHILPKFLNPNGAKRLDLFVPLLTACVRRPELSVSIKLIKQYSEEFPKGTQGKSLVAPILNETIHPSRGSIPVNERKQLLELSIYLKEWHTRKFQIDFNNTSTELLIADDPSIGQLGIDIINLAHSESALSNERRLSILRSLASSMIERKPQPNDTIIQEIALIMEVGEEIFDDELRMGMVEYIREISRPNVPHRQQVLSHLASFSGIPRSNLEELIPELVGYARNEPDNNMRDTIEQTILDLRKRNFTLKTDVWEDMRGYYQSLLTSEDEAQRERGRSLRRKMGQITRDARGKANTPS